MRLAVCSLFLVGFLFGTASADRKFDWSQYLEKPGERAPKKERRETPVVAKEAKKSKAPRAAAAAKQRPAKAVARKGRRR